MSEATEFFKKKKKRGFSVMSPLPQTSLIFEFQNTIRDTLTAKLKKRKEPHF